MQALPFNNQHGLAEDKLAVMQLPMLKRIFCLTELNSLVAL